jgi:hypothetical protein
LIFCIFSSFFVIGELTVVSHVIFSCFLDLIEDVFFIPDVGFSHIFFFDFTFFSTTTHVCDFNSFLALLDNFGVNSSHVSVFSFFTGLV